MYHVVSTGVATTVLYLISYFFAGTGFYSINNHRKFWNTVLALIFLLTLAAGLLLALQITYKWDIPFIKSVLKWHVECGIGLSFTGIFHIIWHFSYFRSLFKNNHTGKTEPEHYNVQLTSKQLIINLLIIGFVSTAVQILLIREVMNFAGGYELIAGTFLGSWIFGSSLGSAAAKKSQLTNIKKINIYFTGSIPITVLLLIFLYRIFLNPGETPSYLISVIITLISLFPFTFISGFAFIRLIYACSKSQEYSTGRSFSFETAGSIIAGILVSLLLSAFFNTYKLLILIIIINFAYVLYSYFLTGRPSKVILIAVSLLFSVFALAGNPDKVFRQLYMGNIEVVSTKDTPYGNITIAEYRGEKSIYYDQRLQSYNYDEIEREENIHYAMLQHSNPENILIISGDINSSLREVLKYKIKNIVFVERDPVLLQAVNIKNDTIPRILHLVNDDPFRYINRTEEKFDVVLLFMPPPSTLQINRFYTIDFFSALKRKMTTNGVFMCSPGSSENYYSKESVVLYSSIFNSLKSNFKNVKPIAGNKLYFVSSDGNVTASVCSLVKARNIKNIYVNQDYLSDDLMNKKSDDVLFVIDPAIRQNSAGFPIACFHYQSYNLSKNLNERIPVIVILILVFVVPVITVKRRNLLMFSSAAALSGFEIIILIILQTVIGNMYLLTGLIISSLMCGMAIGSWVSLKMQNRLILIITGIVIAAFYLVAGLLFNQLNLSGNRSVSLLLILFSVFVPAALTGQLFSILTRSKESFSDPSYVYTADLKGSAAGFVFTSGFLLPLVGISASIISLSLLIFISLLFGIVGNKY